MRMPGQTAVIDGYQHYLSNQPIDGRRAETRKARSNKEQPERSFSKGADFSAGRFNKVDACQGAEEWFGISLYWSVTPAFRSTLAPSASLIAAFSASHHRTRCRDGSWRSASACSSCPYRSDYWRACFDAKHAREDKTHTQSTREYEL